jgi:FKBP-type peptidyl-prolyl cis-trans isomerase (trigger factor)
MSRSPKSPAKPAAKSPAKKPSSARALGHRLKLSPVADILAGPPPKLPDVGTVSLQTLVVPKAPPKEPTEDELLEAYVQRVRLTCPRRERAAKEPLALGDDVTLDVVAFQAETLVPFSFRRAWETVVEPSPFWPGLFEALVGLPVGESATVKVTLPKDAKVLPGETVAVTAVVHRAAEVTLPEGGAEAAFASLGLGDTFDATLIALMQELALERLDEAEGAWSQAVLEAFAKRWTGEVPASLLDAEVERAWARTEGTLMREAGLSADVQQQSLAQWKADPETRGQLEARLRLELALRALGDAEPPTLTKESVLRQLVPVAEDMGFSPEQMEQALTADKATAEQLTWAAFRLMLVERVLAAAKPG